jgi:Flp pilus assembly CpaF family ATPase
VDEALVRRVRAAVAGELLVRTTDLRSRTGRRGDVEDQEMLARALINEQLERHAHECLQLDRPVLSDDEEETVAQRVFDLIFQLGRLQPLIDDERIINISANGYDQVFLEYADGTKAPGPEIAASDAEMIELMRDIGRRFGLSEREFNQARPQLNLQLPDGSRLFGVAWVCSRPCLAIRRHRHMKVDLVDLEALGAIDRGLRSFFAAAVRARKQMMIAGATGAGKTTLLRALAAEIPPHERIVTIETELELGLDRFPDLHPDCVALEAREPNVEGVGEITAADLVRMSLRMSPDRVIVGEVRGAEVIPMLNAMSQGNDGSMCTIHADSSATVFNKLALYAMQSPERLPLEATNLLAAAAIDLLVYISKSHAGRFVASVRQVVGADGSTVVTNEVFRPGADGRAGPGAPIPADFLDDLVAEGYEPDLHLEHAGFWR